MSESNETKEIIDFHCPSCGRSAGMEPNGVETVLYQGREWCTRCARVGRIPNGGAYVRQPSPGCMVEGPTNDPVAALFDCYDMRPKGRIKIREAEREIQRAWVMWNGDKESREAMHKFFAWLGRYRPYFLTFRTKYDPWQRVHSWLIQFERANR